jgi:hypothetical protein
MSSRTIDRKAVLSLAVRQIGEGRLAPDFLLNMGVFLEMRPPVSIAHRLGGNTTIPLADIGRAAETLAGLSESALAAFAGGFPAIDANVLLVLLLHRAICRSRVC